MGVGPTSRLRRRRRTTQRTDVGGGRPSLPKVEGFGQLRVKGRPTGVATAIAQAGTSPIRSGTLSRRSLAMGILAWIVLGLVAGAGEVHHAGPTGWRNSPHHRARYRRCSRRGLPGHVRARLRRHFRVRFTQHRDRSRWSLTGAVRVRVRRSRPRLTHGCSGPGPPWTNTQRFVSPNGRILLANSPKGGKRLYEGPYAPPPPALRCSHVAPAQPHPAHPG